MKPIPRECSLMSRLNWAAPGERGLKTRITQSQTWCWVFRERHSGVPEGLRPRPFLAVWVRCADAKRFIQQHRRRHVGRPTQAASSTSGTPAALPPKPPQTW
jgi:hypothetical protein